MRAKKNILIKVALLACTIAILMGLIEMLLRLAMDRPEMEVGTIHTPKAEYYGWAPIPGANTTFVNPDNEDRRPVLINSQGWKDVEHSITNPEGKMRILFLGDSFTYGLVPLEALYTRKVEQKLIDHGINNIEVISMGVGSWGTDQALEALIREGVEYQPDVVIYQFCGNDIENNMQPREELTNFTDKIYLKKPFRYKLNGGKLEKIKIPKTISEPTISRKDRLKHFLLESEIVYRMNIIRVKVKKSLLEKNRKPRWTQNYNSYRVTPDGPWKPEDGKPHRQAEWDLFEALILKMRAIAIDAGAKFVVFTESGDEGLRQWYLLQGLIENDGESDYVLHEGKKHYVDYKRPLKELSEICQRNTIPLIEPVRKYERYKNDIHTNAEGNNMMAEDIVDFLLSWKHF